jgi:hypothetical protein
MHESRTRWQDLTVCSLTIAIRAGRWEKEVGLYVGDFHAVTTELARGYLRSGDEH